VVGKVGLPPLLQRIVHQESGGKPTFPTTSTVSRLVSLCGAVGVTLTSSLDQGERGRVKQHEQLIASAFDSGLLL